jgi:VCBS repeat protein
MNIQGCRASCAVVTLLLATGVSARAQEVVFGAPTRIETGSRPLYTDADDLNGDGYADVMVANSGSDTISVLFGDGLGRFSPPMTFPSGDKPWSLSLGDLDGDSFEDLAVACGASNAVAVHFGHGDGTFDPPLLLPVGRVPRWATIVDLDGDGRLDILASNYGSNDLSVLTNLGNRQFAPEVRWPSGEKPSIIAMGDVNGDTLPDLFFANRYSDNLWLMFANPAGGFDPPITLETSRRPYFPLALDVNGDGFADIVTVNLLSPGLSVLLGDGHGGFQPHVDYDTHGRRSSFAAATDVDADGDLDLAITNIDTNDITIMENDGNGVFTDVMHLGGLVGAVGAYAADFDRDGAPDLVAADMNGTMVSIFPNHSDLWVRHGTVNCGIDHPYNVLFANGSAGDFRREMTVHPGEPVRVNIVPPPAGPASAHFAVYAWGREPRPGTSIEVRSFGGRIIMPIPASGGRPQPHATANNLGYTTLLGMPTRDSLPAPSILMDRPDGLRGSHTISVQGFIEDAAARTRLGLSVTNALIIHIE